MISDIYVYVLLIMIINFQQGGTSNRSEAGIVFCNIAVVLEFGDGWLLDSLVVVEEGVK